MAYDSFAQTLMWDLRVFRVEMIAQYWIDIIKAQKERNYPDWLRLMHLCESSINHAYSKEYDNDEYVKKRKAALELANKHQKVFCRRVSDFKIEGEIEESLIAIQKYLWKQTDKCGLFGKSREIRGL